MANYFSSEFTLGIFGGGQLGKMLLYETRKYDIKTKVLDPSAEAPCRIACNTFVQGELMDFDTVYSFGKDVDLLTIEIEGVNVDAIEKLESEGLKVFPSSQTLRNIQNKGRQKQFYTKHNIPTSAFQLFQNLQELKEAVLANKITFLLSGRVAPVATTERALVSFGVQQTSSRFRKESASLKNLSRLRTSSR